MLLPSLFEEGKFGIYFARSDGNLAEIFSNGTNPLLDKKARARLTDTVSRNTGKHWRAIINWPPMHCL